MNKTLAGSIAIAIGLTAANVHAQVTVFSDNFNRSTGLSPAPNGASYTTTATGDGGASIVSNILTLTNDASATANANGNVSNAISTTSFAAPYNTTLSSNGFVTWNFNMRQIRSDGGAGFAAGNYGVAFVLAGSNSNFTLGSGYAITLGNPLTPDPIRLVNYSAGVGTSTTVITGTGAFADPLNHFLSIRVKYTASSNTWQLFGRDDGTTSFTDPTSGTLALLGTGVNSTSTGIALGNLGEFWNFATAAGQTALFDNVSVAVPEPGTVFGSVLAACGLLVSQRRRLARLVRPASS